MKTIVFDSETLYVNSEIILLVEETDEYNIEASILSKAEAEDCLVSERYARIHGPLVDYKIDQLIQFIKENCEDGMDQKLEVISISKGEVLFQGDQIQIKLIDNLYNSSLEIIK